MSDRRVGERAALARIRSAGEMRLGFCVRDGRTRMTDSYQAGCLRVRALNEDSRLCAVTLNTSGGVAGGDRLKLTARWAPGAAATIATQAAEKVYGSFAGTARIETALDIEPDATAEWLPQESILFDDSILKRSTSVRLAGDASFLGLEAFVLGRTAMAERFVTGRLQDSWRVWRDGRLIYADALDLHGGARGCAGMSAGAVILVAGGRAESLLGEARLALSGVIGRAAASAWNGMLVIRLLTEDGESLRDGVLRVLAALRGGLPPPRVWAC